MVTLPQVDEDQEEDVWCVLEIRCTELIPDDDAEQSVHVPEPDTLLLNPSTDKSDNSQTKLAKEVIPRNADFLRPLFYTD